MTARSVPAVCVLLGLLTDSASAQFSGTFELRPAGCEQQGECTLTYDFKYVDRGGIGWQAAAQNTTDGASIPKWVQPFIGAPFDSSYVKAAVIHDHYCDRHVRSWRATHRVFYEALLELGVDSGKAKLMYYAVYLGGPKWAHLIPGNPCGANCVFGIEVTEAGEGLSSEFQLAGGGNDMVMELPRPDTAGPGVVITRSPDYEAPGFIEELQKVDELLSVSGDQIDLEYLERRAREQRPNDFFYENDSQIELNRGFAFQ